MWNYSSPAADDLDSYYPDQVEFSNQTAVDSASSSSSSLAQLHCSTTLSFAINTLGAGAICLFGLVGNFLSILVIGDDPKASAVTVLLLQSLAIADNFFLAVWLVQFFQPLALQMIFLQLVDIVHLPFHAFFGGFVVITVRNHLKVKFGWFSSPLIMYL